MAKLYFFFNQIILLVSFGTLIFAAGDPTLHVKITHVSSKMGDNPYFGKWEAQLESGGEVVTIKCPVKAEPPKTTMVKFEIIFGDMDIPKSEMTICDAFDDETIAKDMLAKGQPSNFAKTCDEIKPGNDWIIKSWKLPADKIPPGVPDGKFTGIASMYDPEKESEPYMEFKVEGELFHKLPRFGK